MEKHEINFELFGKHFRIIAVSKENALPLVGLLDLPLTPAYVVTDAEESFSASILQFATRFEECYEVQTNRFGIKGPFGKVGDLNSYITDTDKLSFEQKVAVETAIKILERIDLIKFLEHTTSK